MLWFNRILIQFLDKWFVSFKDYSENQTKLLDELITSKTKCAVIVGDGISYDIARDVSEQIKGRYKVDNGYRLADLLDAMVFEFIHEAMVTCYQRDPNASIQDIHDLSLGNIHKFNKKVKKANRELLKHSQHVSVHKTIKFHSYKTTFRYVNRIDAYEKDVLRFGEAKAKRMHPVIKAKVKPTRPLERVEMDHSFLPFYVIDGETFLPLGSVWFTAALDSATGSVGGFHLAFEDPSYQSNPEE
ncbi:MAG: hypothetical protein WBM69_11855 [Desulfobacterales bacterium]